VNIPADSPAPAVIERSQLEALFDALKARGFELAGPTIRDGAIVYDQIHGVDNLPAGWTEVQEAGRYRLRKRSDAALFGYPVGPHSWKKYLFPPATRLWSATRTGSAFEIDDAPETPPKRAFIGVRSCDLHAIAIQDRVFIGGGYVDPTYARRRENIFIVAINCAVAGGTCFCVSMKTGPKAERGFDLALTEMIEESRHYFLVEIGSPAGAELLDAVKPQPALSTEIAAARTVTDATAAHMGRTLETDGIKELLYANLEHPRWNEVAQRCLTCANCTMVCPTCFCSTIEDTTDLTGDHAERWRKWDSCFTMDHSHVAGGSVRTSARSRYRQWLTHKLATWIDQFGSSGCTGCGRCITWCPVGIDLTEEARVIRETA
jgi:ferredoxin